MLRGIARNRIIVGAYADGENGICPMLAAHRNGGRTDFASFADAWDAFTGAKRRPRRATRREVRVLRTYLEMSLLNEDTHGGSLAEIADGIRAERRAAAERGAWRAPDEIPEPDPPAVEPQRPRPGDPFRAPELRLRPRWSWLRPARRLDVFEATMAAAEEQLTEQRADEVLGERRRTHAID
jgi:hypothetical protein